jgi:broad specificity phosphatase PhoE
MLAQKGPILRLLFARHGHPDYRTDTLTALGHQEAAQLAEALDPYPLDAIYVSTHGRAQETAEYTLRRRSQNPILCDWLREIDGRYGYEGNAPEWIVGDPRPSAYELHPSDLFGSSQLYSYEEWRDQVEYGPWLYPRFSALQAAFDEILAQAGYVREGLRYRVRASDERTLAFFCHDGVMRGLLSHLLYIPLPAALSLFCHDTAGYTMLRSIEDNGYAVFAMVFINNAVHKQNGNRDQYTPSVGA